MAENVLMRTLTDQTEFCKLQSNLQGSEFQTLLGFELDHLLLNNKACWYSTTEKALCGSV